MAKALRSSLTEIYTRVTINLTNRMVAADSSKRIGLYTRVSFKTDFRMAKERKQVRMVVFGKVNSNKDNSTATLSTMTSQETRMKVTTKMEFSMAKESRAMTKAKSGQVTSKTAFSMVTRFTSTQMALYSKVSMLMDLETVKASINGLMVGLLWEITSKTLSTVKVIWSGRIKMSSSAHGIMTSVRVKVFTSTEMVPGWNASTKKVNDMVKLSL